MVDLTSPPQDTPPFGGEGLPAAGKGCRDSFVHKGLRRRAQQLPAYQQRICARPRAVRIDWPSPAQGRDDGVVVGHLLVIHQQSHIREELLHPSRAAAWPPGGGPPKRSPPYRRSDTGCPSGDRSAASSRRGIARSPASALPCSRTRGLPPAARWSGRRAWAAPLSSVHGWRKRKPPPHRHRPPAGPPPPPGRRSSPTPPRPRPGSGAHDGTSLCGTL